MVEDDIVIALPVFLIVIEPSVFNASTKQLPDANVANLHPTTGRGPFVSVPLNAFAPLAIDVLLPWNGICINTSLPVRLIIQSFASTEKAPLPVIP